MKWSLLQMQKSNWLRILSFVFFLWTAMAQGQNAQEKILIEEALDTLSELYQVQFNYKSDLLKGIKVFPLSRKRSLTEHIKELENQTSLRFTKIGAAIFTINKVVEICGYLQEITSLQPLEGATINTAKNGTTTDAEGFFKIEVASQDEDIEIRYVGFKTIKRKARFFNTTACLPIKMYEEVQNIAAVVIEGYLVKGIDKKSDGTTAINFSRFTALPGLIETDVLQAVQALPGVTSIDETVSNINVRGGSHDQNLILWDDIKMYQSGHFFGLISSFNPQITDEVTVITNGTDAAYTDGVSSSIKMSTDRKLQKDLKVSAGINFLSADIFADIPIGAKSSLQLAGRRSINDVYNTPTYDAYFERVTQQTELETNSDNVLNSNQEFNFYDASLRWLYKPSDKDIIRLNFIAVNNNLTFDESLESNQLLDARESSLSQSSIGVGLNYERTWNDHFTTHFNVYNTDYKLQGINANVPEEQRFLQENTVSETGVKFKGLYRWKELVLETGFQFVESEVVNVTDIDVPRFLRRDSEIIREGALFFQSLYENSKGDFSIKPGVRVNYITEFEEFIIEPRLSVRKELGTHFQVELLGEYKHQNTSQVVNFQNDFLGIERRRWQLADNEDIPILKSRQASLGIQYLGSGWLVDASGYLKEVDGITSQSQGFTTKYEFTRTTGSYQVLGLDFLARKQFKNISAWMGYSFMINEYTFNELEELQFPSNFDNTHSLRLGITYFTKFLNLSGGLKYRTGAPTTLPELGNEVVDNEINFGIANSSRLDNYVRVDLSALYKLKIATKVQSEIGASVWNVLNTENTINDFYRVAPDNTPTQFSRLALGLTTNFVMRLKF